MGCTSVSTKVCIILIIFVYLFSFSHSKKDNIEAGKEFKPATEIKDNDYEVIKIIKKTNPSVYTQGLLYKEFDNKKWLVESGGLYDVSTLNIYDTEDNFKKIQNYKLSPELFAEGIAEHKDHLFQLTWQERKVLDYKRNSVGTYDFVKYLEMPPQLREGWGLASKDENTFIATDGSDKIYFIDPETFKVTKSISVVQNNQPVYSLNEIKAIDENRAILNVYYSKSIYIVDLNTGKVLKEIKMNKLVKYEIDNGSLGKQNIEVRGYVLNGITKMGEYYLLTGKGWDYFYIVKITVD